MSLFGWLKGAKPAAGSRFSDALHETGAYRVDYGDWRPIALPGDPMMVGTMPRRQAVDVSRQLLAMAPERAEAARRVLAGHGVIPGPRPQDWDEVEAVLGQLQEPNLEGQPKGWNWTPWRPSYWAFLHDVGFLYAEALCASHPGARFVEAGGGGSSQAGYLSPLPVVVRPPQDDPVTPIQAAILAGFGAMNGGNGHVLADSFALLDAGADRLTQDDVAAWHTEFVEAEGRLPTPDEIAAFVVDHRGTEVDLPPEIAARMDLR